VTSPTSECEQRIQPEASTTPLLLTGATLPDATTADVLIDQGRIAGVWPEGTTSETLTATAAHLDLTGFLLLPALAEPHAHLDKVLTAELLRSAGGGLDDAVRAWYAYRATAGHREIATRATAAAEMMLEQGVTAIRTHVDVGTQTGQRYLTALLDVRESLLPRLEMQIVAFVDEPVTGLAGAGNRAALRTAMSDGATAVGGAPYRDADPVESQRTLLKIAADFSAPADLHTDETLDPAAFHLTELAAYVSESGHPYKVTASHCVSLGTQPDDIVRRVSADLAAAGIAVVCCPATNLYLQGRDRKHAAPRGLTALRRLMAAGVHVAAGGDNIQDPFNPLGRGDPLDTAALLVLAGHLDVDEAYAAVGSEARTAMGLPEARITSGAAAELLAIRATSVRQAIAQRPADRIVFHEGRVVSRTDTVRTRPAPAKLTI
jgi:cytosine deaminase